jgi:hypothetical protein
LIEEDDEDEPTWPKELYKLSFSNFGAGRGKLSLKKFQYSEIVKRWKKKNLFMLCSSQLDFITLKK